MERLQKIDKVGFDVNFVSNMIEYICLNSMILTAF